MWSLDSFPRSKLLKMLSLIQVLQELGTGKEGGLLVALSPSFMCLENETAENSHGHGSRNTALHLNGDLNVLAHVGGCFAFHF